MAASSAGLATPTLPNVARLSTAAASPETQIFSDEVSLHCSHGIAVVTFTATHGHLSWGTMRQEHRWNPNFTKAFSEALDAVEHRQDVQALVVTNEGKYWSNGMDLKYLDTHSEDAVKEHVTNVNSLLIRLLTFPIPTIAAIRGHWCAVGGMMGLAFDYRVMSTDRGFFFIPGVDLGLVYAPVQVHLMKAKLPVDMQREVIIFNRKRWQASELMTRNVVEAAVPASEVMPRAMTLAQELRAKGKGPARSVLGKLKTMVYRQVVDSLELGGDMLLDGRTEGVDRAAPPSVTAGTGFESEIRAGARSKL